RGVRDDRFSQMEKIRWVQQLADVSRRELAFDLPIDFGMVNARRLQDALHLANVFSVQYQGFRQAENLGQCDHVLGVNVDQVDHQAIPLRWMEPQTASDGLRINYGRPGRFADDHAGGVRGIV